MRSEAAPRIWGHAETPPELVHLGSGVLHGWGPAPAWLEDDVDLAEGLDAIARCSFVWASGGCPRVSAHPWLDPIDRTRQAWAGDPACPPSEDRFAPTSGCRPDIGAYGPGAGGMSTTSLLRRTVTSDEGEHCEWPRRSCVIDFVGLGPGTSIWRVAAARDAAVTEVRTAADWRALVERFPARIDPRDRACPPGFTDDAPVDGLDWGAAARAHDGVIRITSEALVRMAFVQIPVLDAVSIWLPDVLEDRTIWLRWVFEEVEHLGPWQEVVATDVMDLADDGLDPAALDDQAIARRLLPPLSAEEPAADVMPGVTPVEHDRVRRLRALAAEADGDPVLAHAIRALRRSDLADETAGTPLAVAVDPPATGSGP